MNQVASCSVDGNVRLDDSSLAENLPFTAFNCGDTHPLPACTTNYVYLAGDTKVSQYNLSNQKLINISRTSNSKVTCILIVNELVIVGTSSGSIEIYNFVESISCKLIEFRYEIVHLWSVTDGSFYVASSDGSIHHLSTHDRNSLPNMESVQCESVHLGTPLSCLTTHPLLPNLVSYGTTDQSLKLCELNGTPVHLQSIKYHEGFLGQRLGGIDLVVMHEGRMVMGAITSDNFVSIWSVNK